MKKIKYIVVIFLSLATLEIFGQKVVHDPMTMVQMVLQFKKEVEQWDQRISHWASMGESFKAELEHFTSTKDQWTKEGDWLQKILSAAEVNKLIFDHFTGPLGSNFNWDDLRLQNIDEFLNTHVVGQGNDPYGGLFTTGSTIESAFPGLRDWTAVQNTDRYKNNTEYQQFVTQLIEDQKKMLDDMENKIGVLSKLNKLVPEREKKLQEIQKKLEECSKSSTMNLPSMWVLASEVSFEISREMFHLVTLNRIEAENEMLDQLRELNQQKKENKFESKNVEKDNKAVTDLMTGK